MTSGCYFRIITLFLTAAIVIFSGCTREEISVEWTESDYSGVYANISYSETMIGAYDPGIYRGDQIPDDIMQMGYGRLEIDFRYFGGGLDYFAPLFYYGSMNKNETDDLVEEPRFHLALEIGHYNVIPVHVEYLFYTICTHNYPQYCRDTYFPVIPGIDYTVVLDKKPEGLILQLKSGDRIHNIFPHAFFSDSAQMFFRDVTSYTNRHAGDSLQKVMMVGRGFAGIERGIHFFNGEVSEARLIKYDLTEEDPAYEMLHISNQHFENQQVVYLIRDQRFDDSHFIEIKAEHWPYHYNGGEMIPNGNSPVGIAQKIRNNQKLIYRIGKEDVGFYSIHLQTVDDQGNLLQKTQQPFEIWVYPKELY
jgi:hypothetical protein